MLVNLMKAYSAEAIGTFVPTVIDVGTISPQQPVGDLPWVAPAHGFSMPAKVSATVGISGSPLDSTDAFGVRAARSAPETPHRRTVRSPGTLSAGIAAGPLSGRGTIPAGFPLAKHLSHRPGLVPAPMTGGSRNSGTHAA
jgi:hypothetical protein